MNFKLYTVRIMLFIHSVYYTAVVTLVVTTSIQWSVCYCTQHCTVYSIYTIH